jgi:transposase
MASLSVSELSRFIESGSHQPFWMGLDVHKRSYYIALLRFDGSVFTWSAPSDPEKIVELIHKHQICILGACYEAGPTGFSLARTLKNAGIPVTVAAPNKIPRSVSPGSKTDRLDCTKLARFVSKGLIRPIAIPTVKEESERALMRRRHQVTNSIRRSMQRIKSQLLYNGLNESESIKRWSKKSIEELHSTLLTEEAKIVIEGHRSTIGGIEP